LLVEGLVGGGGQMIVVDFDEQGIELEDLEVEAWATAVAV